MLCFLIVFYVQSEELGINSFCVIELLMASIVVTNLIKVRIQGNIMAIITLHITECHVRTANCGSKKIITGKVICPYICSIHIFLLNVFDKF